MRSVQPSSHGIQTHLLFLGLGFCLCNNGIELQARGSCPWAYSVHCFHLHDLKRFSYYKAKLPSKRKVIFFKLHPGYSLSPQPSLPLHTKQTLSKPRCRKCYTRRMKPLVRDGNTFKRFFYMLVTTPTEKSHVTDSEKKKGELMALAILRQGHFWYRHWKDLEKQVFTKSFSE